MDVVNLKYFVALYISNKKGKSIWSYVFIFNSIILRLQIRLNFYNCIDSK